MYLSRKFQKVKYSRAGNNTDRQTDRNYAMIKLIQKQ